MRISLKPMSPRRHQITQDFSTKTATVSPLSDILRPLSDLSGTHRTYHSTSGGATLKRSAGSWASPTSGQYSPMVVLTPEPFYFSVGACQSYDDLFSDFSRMRNEFNARYVRLYSWCDGRNNEFPADVVRAAYNAGIGTLSAAYCSIRSLIGA